MRARHKQCGNLIYQPYMATELPLTMRPERKPWSSFPDVLLHAEIPAVKGHIDYMAAKTGDAKAASRLIRDLVSDAVLAAIRNIAGPDRAVLVSVHAVEELGTNAIPEALARATAEFCNLEVDKSIAQANVVNHTGASGFARLARQAVFGGSVKPDRSYVILDDFIGQGGTITNLRGFLEKRGARVILAVALTGKAHSVKLVPEPDQLVRLRRKHAYLEGWWQKEFGFGFDCLTASEARYLERSADADTIRIRIAEAK